MSNRSLVRKIGYILAIVALLLPLFYLGRPSGKGSGKISELRSHHKIGQADLGRLDPTSESMRLATLGLKGIASTVLWLRADYYKEEKYFDRFSATLNQIALLQPHFISVWQHQAHNLSYNVSPEFEDYHQRFEWVKKGIDYLVRGTKYNSRKPVLQYDLGHYVGNKLGKADEKKQYRELFRNDEDFHQYFVSQGLNALQDDARGPDRKPDNWLVGKLWFEEAYELVANGAPIKKSPHLLYSYGPLWQLYHGEAIEEEGVLDERAKFAWERGGRDWKDFGNRELGVTSFAVTLRGLENAKRDVDDYREMFENATKEARPKAIAIKRQQLADKSPEKLATFEKPLEERTQKDNPVIWEVEQFLKPNYQEIAAQLPRAEQLDALAIAANLTQAEEYYKNTESLRNQVNYEYWETRAKAEQQQMMVDARRLMFEADKLIDVADVKGAVDSYEQAWIRWDRVFRYYPSMMTEEVGDDVIKSIGRYKKLIDRDLDESFVLNEFMKFRRLYNADSMDMNVGRIMEAWEEAAKRFGTADDYFSMPLGSAFSTKSEADEAAPAATETKPSDMPTEALNSAQPESPTTNDPPPTTPAAESSSATVPPPATTDAPITASSDGSDTPRPPTLENPDSQE